MSKKINKSVEEYQSSIEDGSPSKMKEEKSYGLIDENDDLDSNSPSEKSHEKDDDDDRSNQDQIPIENTHEINDMDIYDQSNSVSFENEGRSQKTSCCKKIVNKYNYAKKKFGQQSLTIQVSIFLAFFLFFIAVKVTLGVYFMMDVTYQLLDEKINISNINDLAKEVVGEMDVFKNMSQRYIDKDTWLMTGVMSADTVANYPLDWTVISSGIPQFSAVSASQLTSDPGFGGNKVAQSQMTYVLVNNDASNDFTTDQLKRLNILNEIWKKINLVRLGYNFDVNVTSTFYMIQDITNGHQIIATFPGQGITAQTFTNYNFYNQARSDTSQYIAITIQNDPFNSGITQVIGYCKGFDISGKYKGVVGVLYNSSLMKNLIQPIANKSDSVTFSLYQVTSSGDKLLASTDTANVISGPGNVQTILTLTTSSSNLVLKDVIKGVNGEYLLRDSSPISNSGAVYKAAAINGPYYSVTSQQNYDFRAILLQSNDVLVTFANKMKEDINSKFEIVYILLPFECIVLCIIVGVIIYCTSIKELVQTLKELKKENFIEIKSKRGKKYIKEINVNDEIKTLKKIFYDLFNEESNDQKNDSTQVLSNYDYPLNIYYNEAIKQRTEVDETVKNPSDNKFEHSDDGRKSDKNVGGKNSSDLSDNDAKAKKNIANEEVLIPPIQIPVELLLKQLEQK